MNSATLALVVAGLYAGCLVPPLQAFSAVESSPARAAGRRGAMFQDEDCEDLCDAFGSELVATAAAAPPRSATARPRRPRRALRALWWAEEGQEKCATCRGSGEVTCRFCGGTSFLAGMGGDTDALFLEGVGHACPVCRDDGMEPCRSCAGTGIVFSWAKAMNHTESLHGLHP